MRIPKRRSEKPHELDSDPVMTEAKFRDLQKKLERLKSVARPKAIVETKAMAELGDFSENFGYHVAKARLRGINDQILRLEHLLKNAVIVQNTSSSDIIEIGQTITIENDRGQVTYTILGSAETNPHKGVISYSSPLGAALMGRRVGDVIKVRLAKGEVSYKVIKIE